ncbi:uncharacterized protein LOC121302101 [Polyodon spathula]|uniref:uncharacterized protein LOC121302101 n=1 Tax=Polyodon spathula TaxID=7913 RepID=UPI001B7DE481|nr:uncharacterized protein LOC121302101 [Polyodon spathula]
MSGRLRSRPAANSADKIEENVNERILAECYALYVDRKSGLVKAADALGLPLLAPRKKISIMLMGNHSAGKSSFINWYVGEHIQRTGVAIETQGFTFVTSGRRRESLTGNATLHLYQHFQKLEEISGVSDYLSTEISTSREKKFGLVTFIDTPGLVDGDMKYEFDVERALLWLGESNLTPMQKRREGTRQNWGQYCGQWLCWLCDLGSPVVHLDHEGLVLVFFDPMGQALCKRTLNIVERLSEENGEKMRFYLSKADEAGDESDRQRVMMQIVQELCKRPGLNKCGFDMPTIYIPDPAKPSRCLNQIDGVCGTIEKIIDQTVQSSLNHLERDSDIIAESVERRLKEDSYKATVNRKIRIKHFLFGCLGYLLPLCFLASFVIGCFPDDSLTDMAGPDVAHALHVYTEVVSVLWGWLAWDSSLWGVFVILGSSGLFLLLARLYSRTEPTLSRRQKRYLRETHAFIQEVVKPRKAELYDLYLRQCISDYDVS